MKRGDIVLIRWPFSDLSSDKVRPALIISSDKHTYRSEDAVFLFISSKTQNPQTTDLLFDQSDPEFCKSGLKKSSLIKTTKIASLSKSLASNLLGEASPIIMERVKGLLIEALNLN
jgi:mRNA interferase MazF